ncbi:MAG: hypothetical protein II877_01360 [Synergistaceae bacterium]|nr:hypothetical protein [Synergistaceae bacterium]
MITEEMKEHLMKMGLTKQQVESKVAETLFNILMTEDGKTLIQEARLQVNEMSNIVISLSKEYNELKEKIDAVAGALLDIAKAQEEHGALTDEKARNALVFYSALLKMNESAGARGSESVENAGYVTYAYLGGQARRDIHYEKARNDDD